MDEEEVWEEANHHEDSDEKKLNNIRNHHVKRRNEGEKADLSKLKTLKI